MASGQKLAPSITFSGAFPVLDTVSQSDLGISYSSSVILENVNTSLTINILGNPMAYQKGSVLWAATANLDAREEGITLTAPDSAVDVVVEGLEDPPAGIIYCTVDAFLAEIAEEPKPDGIEEQSTELDAKTAIPIRLLHNNLVTEKLSGLAPAAAVNAHGPVTAIKENGIFVDAQSFDEIVPYTSSIPSVPKPKPTGKRMFQAMGSPQQALPASPRFNSQVAVGDIAQKRTKLSFGAAPGGTRSSAAPSSSSSNAQAPAPKNQSLVKSLVMLPDNEYIDVLQRAETARNQFA